MSEQSNLIRNIVMEEVKKSKQEGGILSRVTPKHLKKSTQVNGSVMAVTLDAEEFNGFKPWKKSEVKACVEHLKAIKLNDDLIKQFEKDAHLYVTDRIILSPECAVTRVDKNEFVVYYNGELCAV
jgi:hypothetical protein